MKFTNKSIEFCNMCKF